MPRPAPKARPAKRRTSSRQGPSPQELNRILDKVRDHGVQSLTDREQQLLEKAGRERQ